MSEARFVEVVVEDIVVVVMVFEVVVEDIVVVVMVFEVVVVVVVVTSGNNTSIKVSKVPLLGLQSI